MRPNRQLFRVERGPMVYGFVMSIRYVVRDGKEYIIRRCISAAPCAKWTIGKPSENIALWLKEKRAIVTLVDSYYENEKDEVRN